MMNNAEALYTEIGNGISDARAGTMFGWKCFKYRNKPFIYFDKKSGQAMVFKLAKEYLADALNLEGAVIFNPGDKGRPMKNWVVIPYQHSGVWKEWTLRSYQGIIKDVQLKKR